MEFTNEEKQRIDQIYGNDFKNATVEDIPLIQKWEEHKATLQAEQDAKLKAIEEEIAAKLKAITEQAEYSMNTLEILRDKAVERYERVSHGKEE